MVQRTPEQQAERQRQKKIILWCVAAIFFVTPIWGFQVIFTKAGPSWWTWLIILGSFFIMFMIRLQWWWRAWWHEEQ